MFREINYSDMKSKNIWKNESLLDIKKIHPYNLQFKYLKDGSVEYCKTDTNAQNIDLARLYDIVKNNIYLQIYLCNVYFYFKNFNIELTTHLICSASELDENDLNIISHLFQSTTFTEEYPIFENDIIIANTQALQTTGLSRIGTDISKKLFNNDLILDSLYNNKIANDISRTSFYEFKCENEYNEDTDFKLFVNRIFENAYFKQCGVLNVSAASFAALNNHPLCIELSKWVNNLYLLNYDMEYEGKVVFVKYLQWN